MNSGEQNQTSKPDLYVLARIIEALKEHGPTHRTALATATGLAYDRMGKYLQWMSEKGFIKKADEENDPRIALTDQGLKAYDEFVSWILRYVGRLKFPKI